jgi:hypothetical protein
MDRMELFKIIEEDSQKEKNFMLTDFSDSIINSIYSILILHTKRYLKNESLEVHWFESDLLINKIMEEDITLGYICISHYYTLLKKWIRLCIKNELFEVIDSLTFIVKKLESEYEAAGFN